MKVHTKRKNIVNKSLMVDKGKGRENYTYSIIVLERESVIVIKKIYFLFMKY